MWASGGPGKDVLTDEDGNADDDDDESLREIPSSDYLDILPPLFSPSTCPVLFSSPNIPAGLFALGP